MRAVVISRHGGPEVLEIREFSDPKCGPEELLVGIRATALNRADLLQRRGLYPAPPGAPQNIPGLEFAGEVQSCGEATSRFRAGDRVMGILGGGGYAEKVALHEGLCIKVPDQLGWEEAAAVPEAFLTAYDALHRQAALRGGEFLLLQAAASGVGTAALQLAASAGAEAICLSRSEPKRRWLESQGGWTVLDPGMKNLVEAVLDRTAGKGVDVILDMVGASAWPLHSKLLGEKGRMVVIGLMGGSRCEIELGQLLGKRWTIIGSILRGRPLSEKIELTREFSERALPLFEKGSLRPVVDRVLPLSDAAEAHGVMERNENLGKIVLTLGRE